MEMFNNRKRNPLSAIDASYEDHVEAIDTIRKKIEANTISEGTNTLSRLDGFEKQLEEREALLKQKENNIKNTIEAQTEEKEIKVKREFVENEFEDIKTEEKEIKVKREFGEEIKKKIKDNV
uniref:Uncharacterized protein n=1 Tax=Rhizophagus irregularis (strain DAOM 181602 / DAOM 197198 / MUCL 43194) TaxID=747089 RepID=U9SLH7_RHIID